MEGYIKAFRTFLNWEWYTTPNTMRVFFHCLLRANYQESNWKGIKIPLGSFVTSIAKLASELDLTPEQVKYAINNLKLTNEITTNSTNKNTIINVVNWAKYQSNNLEIPQQNQEQIPFIFNSNSTQIPFILPTDKNIKNKRNKESLKPLSFDKVKIDVFGEFSNGDGKLLNALKEFNEMRIRIRKPMTDKAKIMLVNKLQEFKDKGHNVVEILEQSVFNSWQGVFEVKEEFRKIKQKEKPVDEQRTGTYF